MCAEGMERRTMRMMAVEYLSIYNVKLVLSIYKKKNYFIIRKDTDIFT